MQFSGFAVSVRGASHEDSGTPCQDSARVLITDKLAVAAVSDGHGSEKHFRSASGSEMAARVALRSVTDFCERNGSLGEVFRHDPREAAQRVCTLLKLEDDAALEAAITGGRKRFEEY